LAFVKVSFSEFNSFMVILFLFVIYYFLLKVLNATRNQVTSFVKTKVL